MFAVIGFLALALLSLRRRVDWGNPSLWVWPLPSMVINGVRYDAVISDGVGTDRPDGASHRGVDIMYRRKNARDLPQYPTRDGHSPGHVAPPFTPVLAARDGSIWSVAYTPRGWTVVISHTGSTFATYYTHLQSVAFPAHRNGVNVATGKPTVIGRGDYIGAVGWDPMDKSKTRHLHFAVWAGGPESHAVDPEPAMKTWPRAAWQWDPMADNEDEV